MSNPKFAMSIIDMILDQGAIRREKERQEQMKEQEHEKHNDIAWLFANGHIGTQKPFGRVLLSSDDKTMILKELYRLKSEIEKFKQLKDCL